MTYYIALPLKKTSEVDLVKPLKNLIAQEYSPCVADVYPDILNKLNELRKNSTLRTFGKHESTLEEMCRYYDQLGALESRFKSNFLPSDIQIPFEWKDAFEMGTSSLMIPSLAYEKVCILFNIAAMLSQIAASQGSNVQTRESLKTASRYFELSSGIFDYLRKRISSVIQHNSTPDLQPDTLSALQILMLAQAQEIIFHKVVLHEMKNDVIAKVASQCEEHYAEALKQMQKESTIILWEKGWINVVGAKQAQFKTVAEYYQSLVCKEENKIGEELARLQLALEWIKRADNRTGSIFSLKEWVGRIEHAFKERMKDNSIYHARIPDPSFLAPVPKADLAKPTPLPDKMSPNFRDLFHNLMLVFMQQNAQTNFLNIRVSKMKEGTQMMNGILASLNLPAAIEDIPGYSIPQSLKDKANAIREKGGLAYVSSLIKELPELLQRNKEILDEADRMLKEEEDTDKQLSTKFKWIRTQFKDKWTRTPWGNLNAPLKANILKYHAMIRNAMNADALLREKFNKHKDMIDLLCKSEEEMLQAIYSAVPTEALSSSSWVQELRMLMAEVEEIKRERETLEERMSTTTFDMRVKLSIALCEDDDALIKEFLSAEIVLEMFGPILKLVDENLEKQERVMAQVEVANREFCKEKDTIATQREAILRDLAAAHDAYMELCSDLKERKKFYNDLTEMLIEFQSKISNTRPSSTSTVASVPPYVPPPATTNGTAYPQQAQPAQASSMGVALPPYQNAQYYQPAPPYTPYAGLQPVPYPLAPFQQTAYIYPYPGYPQQQQQPGAYQHPQQRWS